MSQHILIWHQGPLMLFLAKLQQSYFDEQKSVQVSHIFDRIIMITMKLQRKIWLGSACKTTSVQTSLFLVSFSRLAARVITQTSFSHGLAAIVYQRYRCYSKSYDISYGRVVMVLPQWAICIGLAKSWKQIELFQNCLESSHMIIILEIWDLKW